MSKVPVLIELTQSSKLSSQATTALEASPKTSAIPELAGVKLDKSFGITPVPTLADSVSELSLDAATDDGVAVDFESMPLQETFVVRGEIEEKDAAKIGKQKGVVGVYSDVQIEPQIICPGSAALGTDSTVERLLCTDRLHRMGADGSGVLVAIVDSGINMAHMNAQGKNPTFDAARSWVPRAGLTPGSLPVGHGTMCAFDACIAAPKCTLLDIALLQSNATGPTPMSGFLSDAVRAYAHLIRIMTAPRRPGETRSLVVNNSWGMFHPSWDFPVGHPGNYSDNPNHPFNRIVATLARTGADILFAAGNCGANCPDGRCQGVTANAIYGANSHRDVLSIAGVDTTKQRVGYSSQGPGRLTRNKPDLSGYTHFQGSGVYPADGGTSAATPVVAGVVAAIRTKRPYTPGNPSRSPSAIRSLITSTAQDLGTAGYDFDHGYGVVNGCEIARRLRPVLINICRRYPHLCRIRPVPIDICRRYPQLCRPLPPRRPPFPLPPGPRPGPGLSDSSAEYGMLDLGANPEFLESLEAHELAELMYYAGQYDAIQGEQSSSGGAGAKESEKAGDCGCN